MKTPAGTDCRFYYQNFHRGRSEQECRLVQVNSRSAQWQPKDCSNCPVPEILQANNSSNMVLEGIITSGFLGFGRRVVVKAFCSRHLVDIEEPRIGCRQCMRERPGLRELLGEE